MAEKPVDELNNNVAPNDGLNDIVTSAAESGKSEEPKKAVYDRTNSGLNDTVGGEPEEPKKVVYDRTNSGLNDIVSGGTVAAATAAAASAHEVPKAAPAAEIAAVQKAPQAAPAAEVVAKTEPLPEDEEEKRKKAALIIFYIVTIALIIAFFLVMFTLWQSRDSKYDVTLFVLDEYNESWNEDADLQVFYNEEFGDTVIRPYSYGTYGFYLQNDNANTVVFSMVFSETNEYDIALTYRIKRDGAYVISEYTRANELNCVDLTVEGNSKQYFQIEWYWDGDVSDEKDTLAGINGTVYVLKIDLYATTFVED